MNTLNEKLEALGFTKQTGLNGLSNGDVAVCMHWSGEEAMVYVNEDMVLCSASEEEIIEFVESLSNSEEETEVAPKFDDYEMLNVKKELVLALRNKANRLEKSFEQYEYTDDEIKQTIDDAVGEFMREYWGYDWQEDSQADAFYENTACELRVDLEHKMIELYRDMN